MLQKFPIQYPDCESIRGLATLKLLLTNTAKLKNCDRFSQAGFYGVLLAIEEGEIHT